MPRRSTRRGGAGVDMAKNDATATSRAPSIVFTPEAEQVDSVKTHLAQLCAREDELTAVIEKAITEREAACINGVGQGRARCARQRSREW